MVKGLKLFSLSLLTARSRRKPMAKKHKTWDGDGVLTVKGGNASLRDISGASMAQAAFNRPLLPGSTLSMGGKEVEVDSVISKEQYLKITGHSHSGSHTKQSQSTSAHVSISTPIQNTFVKPSLSLKAQMKAQMLKEKEGVVPAVKGAAPRSTAAKAAFKTPLKDTTIFTPEISRHDPNTPGALVMKRPVKVPKDKQIVDVVIDPILSKHLRAHQREGIKFLYECVMGLRDFGGDGCILADEMGLGKTLQTIALLWTLLKQNPIYGDVPVVKKALIVCPVTLINNWQKEFRKWLGNERIGVFVADGQNSRLTDFTMGKSYNVMIIGYERLRTVADDLTKGSGIDIVVADEGHRLKTVKNKSAKAIDSLNTSKRILLSGTPIQNDLQEFFSMVNFVNDGILGSNKKFIRDFETPIVKSRQPNAIQKDIEHGETRSMELQELTSPFILRRTADVLSHYLPAKTEYVLFCTPTAIQANIYRNVVSSPVFQCALGNTELALQLITILKKLCNSPALLSPKHSDDVSLPTSLTALLSNLPPGLLKTGGNHTSTKIRLLDQLLDQIRTQTDEKIVIVSNYTSTLDLVQNLLASTSLTFLRLDGSTPASKRQAIVDDFNRSSAQSCFAFLLSAKAGGLGLNLIGASRLVLFDVDWNPATDDQAMARIHREGQKRPCKIYRFLVKGAIEERIWQRQVVKRGLADSILDGGASAPGGKNGVAQFTREELKDLFRLDASPGLRTHDLIGCGCGGSGVSGTRLATRAPIPDTAGEDKPFFDDRSDVSDRDDASLPDMYDLINASALTDAKIEEQEAKIKSGTHPLQANAKRKKEDEMAYLLQYAHLDATTVAGLEEESERFVEVEGIVDDECLMNVLRGDGDGEGEAVNRGASRVGYVFLRKVNSRVNGPARK
jgi:DNA repair and recombination protein RAD54B